jgi:hypothetical protein
MLTNLLGAILKPNAAVLLVLLGLCGPALAQEVSLALLQPASIEPNPIVTAVEPVKLAEAPSQRFWDRENTILFTTNAAFSTADFIVTRNNLRNGGQELNPATRLLSGSTAGLAVNFAGEAIGVVAVSYFFHRTGHHKLERAVSILNIGASVGAVTFDLVHH